MVLDLIPELRAIVASGVDLVVEASRIAGLQGDPPGPERDERWRRNLALRCLDRPWDTAWPSSVDRARGVAKATPGVDLEDFDRECAQRIRSVIPAKRLPRALVRPPTAPAPPPAYVEIRFAAPERWEALAKMWDQIGSMKRSGTLDPDAAIWGAHRDAVHFIGSGDYDMLPASRLDESTGRLLFVPWGFPYGGIAWMCSLAEAFGCEVVAHDEGAGRRAGGG
jgi:hypothetical protein